MNDRTTVITQRYRKLISAVSIGYPRESRYETALRFIKERVRQEEEDQKRKTVNKNQTPVWQDKL